MQQQMLMVAVARSRSVREEGLARFGVNYKMVAMLHGEVSLEYRPDTCSHLLPLLP
jgi:hypothetical protein